MDLQHGTARLKVGTLAYMSPEVLNSKGQYNGMQADM